MATMDLGVGPAHPLVWGRAAVVGTVAAGTGVVSHVAGDGFLPGPVVLTLLVVGCVVASAFLLARPASAFRLTAMVVAGQTVVHGVLSTTAGHRGELRPSYLVTPPPTTETDTGDVFERYQQLAGTDTASGHVDVTLTAWWDHQVEHLTAAGGLMVVSHLVGAVVLGLFLAVGEDALWRLVALALARRSVRLGAYALVLADAASRHGVRLQAALVTPWEAQVCGAQLLARRVERHRGPPFVLAA